MAFRKKFLPKTTSDWIPFAGFLIFTFAVYVFEVAYVVPAIYPTYSIITYFHCIVGTFIYVNVVLNFAMLVLVDSSASGKFLPTVLKPEWRYCYVCEQNSPPRSHHCPMCNVCILRRDHHCPWSGYCVGYGNTRYYIAMLFYIAIGGLYANILNVDYVIEELGGFNFRNIFMMILPFVAWLLGWCRGWTLFVAFVSAGTISGMLYDWFLLAFHMNLTVNGQTTHEFGKGNKRYDVGLTKNLSEALGQNWHVAWLFPLLPSPMPGSGLEFVTKELPTEVSKTM